MRNYSNKNLSNFFLSLHCVQKWFRKHAKTLMSPKCYGICIELYEKSLTQYYLVERRWSGFGDNLKSYRILLVITKILFRKQQQRQQQQNKIVGNKNTSMRHCSKCFRALTFNIVPSSGIGRKYVILFYRHLLRHIVYLWHKCTK